MSVEPSSAAEAAEPLTAADRDLARKVRKARLTIVGSLTVATAAAVAMIVSSTRDETITLIDVGPVAVCFAVGAAVLGLLLFAGARHQELNKTMAGWVDPVETPYRTGQRRANTTTLRRGGVGAVIALVLFGVSAAMFPDPLPPREPVVLIDGDGSTPSALAFVLFLAGSPNTPENCDEAFTALLAQPNSGVTEADRAVDVQACVEADQSEFTR